MKTNKNKIKLASTVCAFTLAQMLSLPLSLPVQASLYKTSTTTRNSAIISLDSNNLGSFAQRHGNANNQYLRVESRATDFETESLANIMSVYSRDSLSRFTRLVTTQIAERPNLYTINIPFEASMRDSIVPRSGLIANQTVPFEQIILGTNAFDQAKPFPSIPGFQWPEGTTLVAQQFNGAPDSNLIRMSEASVAHLYPRAVCYQAQYCGQIQGLQLGNSPSATTLQTLRQIGNARIGKYDLILATDFAANKVESVDYYLRVPVMQIDSNVAFATETMRLNTNIQNMIQSMRQALGRRNPVSNAIRIYNQFHKREKDLGYDTSDIEEIAPWILEQPPQLADDSIIGQIAERTAARRYYRLNPTAANVENDFAIVQIRLMMN